MILLFGSCFDYAERVVFAPDFSGYVDYDYEVPVQKTKEGYRSVLGFLPVTRKEISSRVNGLFSGRSLELENYELEYRDPEEGSPFEKLAHVKYRFHFNDPQDLEQILLGNVQVYRRPGGLLLQRSFPGTGKLPDHAGVVATKYHELSLGTMENKKLRFTVIFPWYYDLFTNYGSIVKPGFHTFILPLEATMKSTSGYLWNLNIRANRPPGPVDENL